MNRATEVEILASTLPDPARVLLRSAIVAQRQGRLEASALVTSDQVGKRPSLRWAALLLGLDAAELALGGSVAIGTPGLRYAAGNDALFVERWSGFACTIWPEEIGVLLELVPESTHADPFGSLPRGSLILAARPGLGALRWDSTRVCQVLAVLVRWVGAHLGTRVVFDLVA